MKNYKDRFKKIDELSSSYTKGMFLKQLNEEELDQQFEYIFKESEWLEKLKAIAENSNKIDTLIDQLTRLKVDIIEYYIEYFTINRFIGGKPENFAPDIIIGLGCNNSLGLLDKRIERIGEMIKVYPDAKLLLSGGGFELSDTEACIMKDALLQNSLLSKGDIILEEDSMDTMGNAIFSKLLLKDRGELQDIKNILVVTSPFHAIRARSLFRNIFGNNYNIVVTGHPFHLTQDNFSGYCDLGMNDGHKQLVKDMEDMCDIENLRQKITEHEIRALYKLNKIFTDLGENTGDESSLFYELFLYDSIYNSRYDILRKYRHILARVCSH